MIVVSVALLLQNPGLAQRRGARAAAGNSSPKLLLTIVVDQFRYDYLERFSDLFGAGGFRRLMNGGAVFTDANYEYVPTYTAPGHAAIFTGSIPARNGIVGNTYFDRNSRTVRVMVADEAAHLVTNKGVATSAGAASPRVLIGTTIGDQLRLSNGFQSKVITISLKDRAAVLPGGQRPNGAYWFINGEFVSSDYYASELPAWIKNFNDKHGAEKYFGARWERALPAWAYTRAQAENLEVQISPLGARKFPYIVNGGEDKPGAKFYAAFDVTPFASEVLSDFAKQAVMAEKLGADEFPDLLSVSFSSPDLCGHYYGPDSQEVEDTFVRLDRVIADLLDFIDKQVGLSNTLIAVTGDHGVAPVPEYVRARGIDARRLAARELIDLVNKRLSERYGVEKMVVGFVNDQFYLDLKQIADKKLDQAEVEKAAGEAALSIPGIQTYFTRTDILSGNVGSGTLARRVTNGFNRQLSGDVWIITRPFAFFSEGPLATTHGSPYNYDSHVPIILYGNGVRPGRYNNAASPSDIAPTLAVLFGVEPPSNRVGRVLSEAIAEKGTTRP